MTTLGNYVSSTNWENVSVRLLELYPTQEDNIDKYEKAFSILAGLEADDYSDYVIVVEKSTIDGEDFFEVFGQQAENPDDGDLPETYGIGHQDWEEWLAMEFSPETMVAFKELDLVCHSLFEMTTTGWDPSAVAVDRRELRGVVNGQPESVEQEQEPDISMADLFKQMQDEISKMRKNGDFD